MATLKRYWVLAECDLMGDDEKNRLTLFEQEYTEPVYLAADADAEIQRLTEALRAIAERCAEGVCTLGQIEAQARQAVTGGK